MMTYRNIEERDIPRIKEIIDEGKPYLGQNGYYTYWMMKHIFDGYSYVAEEDDKVCGFVTVLPNPDEQAVFVWQLGVAQQYRGQKIGYNLVKHAHQTAAQKGMPGIITSIDPNNKGSQNTFLKVAREFGLAGKIIGKFEADGFCEDVYKFC